MTFMLSARCEEPGCGEAHTTAVQEHAEDSEEGREEREAKAEAKLAGRGLMRGQVAVRCDVVKRDPVTC